MILLGFCSFVQNFVLLSIGFVYSTLARGEWKSSDLTRQVYQRHIFAAVQSQEPLAIASLVSHFNFDSFISLVLSSFSMN